MKTFLTRDQFTQYYTAVGAETQITLTRTVCRTNTDFAVFRNGLLQTLGVSADYVFIDRYGVQAGNTEAFVSAIKFNRALIAGENIAIISGVISGTNLTDIYNYIGDTGVSTNLTTPYNLNNLIHGGRYFLAYDAGNTNCPVSVDCHIQVFQQDSNNMVQTIYPIDGTSPVWRSYSNGTWNGWNTYSNAPVGSIVSVLASDTYVPNGCLRCDGAEYTSAMFSGFYNNFLLTGKLLTCTYAEYTAQVAITGNCGKFALDTVNQKFKVPILKDGDSITQATSAAELGKSYTAGLPNITGTVYVQGLTYGSAIVSSGSLFAYESGFNNGVSAVSATNGCSTIGLNAAASSPIYGNATTVRDEQVRLRHFVVVANAQTVISSIDWSNYMAGLAGKANIDFDNITLTGKSNAGKAMAYALDYEHPVTFALGDTWTYAPVGGLMVGWVWMDINAPTDAGVVTVGSTNVAGTKKNTTVNTLSCFIDTGVRVKKVAGMHAEDVVIVPWRTA